MPLGVIGNLKTAVKSEAMQSPSTDSYSIPPSTLAPEAQVASQPTPLPTANLSSADSSLMFEGHYAGQMEMGAAPEIVGDYLNRHRGWFPRCAHPMQVKQISEHGYALVVGHFAILGYEVEPKVGLYLSPLDQRIYSIDTIPIPDYEPPGYDVDFKAVLELKDPGATEMSYASMTWVDWRLNLRVKIHVPKFVGALPQALVKSSGDRLLNQVVRQVSKRLTRKVQEDFHTTLNLPLPESYQRHHFWSSWGKTHA